MKQFFFFTTGIRKIEKKIEIALRELVNTLLFTKKHILIFKKEAAGVFCF